RCRPPSRLRTACGSGGGGGAATPRRFRRGRARPPPPPPHPRRCRGRGRRPPPAWGPPRRRCPRRAREREPLALRSALLLDVLPGLPHRPDPLRVLVADLHLVLLLEGHDQLHEVERVRVEILYEGRLRRHLVRLHAELLGDYRLEPVERHVWHQSSVLLCCQRGQLRVGEKQYRVAGASSHGSMRWGSRRRRRRRPRERRVGGTRSVPTPRRRTRPEQVAARAGAPRRPRRPGRGAAQLPGPRRPAPQAWPSWSSGAGGAVLATRTLRRDPPGYRARSPLIRTGERSPLTVMPPCHHRSAGRSR